LTFDNVDLLTLSACQTAVGNGSEVEGLAMVTQGKGAKAVMATLWSVADSSTAQIMAAFYRLKKEQPSLSKAEALRQAQLALLRGAGPAAGSDVNRGIPFSSGGTNSAPSFQKDPEAPFSHPYFWAPFVLYGNWR